MTCLFLVVTLVAISSAQGVKVTKFGCEFENANYKVSGSFPVYSRFEYPGMKIGEFKELTKEFFDIVEKSKSEVFSETLINEVTPYVQIYEALEAAGVNITSKRELGIFAHTYAPPVGSRQTYMDLILKVVDKIEASYKARKDQEKLSFYFAGMATSVSDENIEQLQKGVNPTDVKELLPTNLVGIIKIEYNNYLPAYIIIDMEYATTPTPFLGLRDKYGNFDPSKSYFLDQTYTSFGDPVQFKVLNEDKGYIQFTVSGKTSDAQNNTRNVKSQNVIYVKYPFCSFVEVTNWQLLTNKVKLIAKITPDGKLSAGITTVAPDTTPVSKESACPRDRVIFNNYAQPMITASVANLDQTAESFDQLLTKILGAMNYQKDEQEQFKKTLKRHNELTEKLAKLEKESEEEKEKQEIKKMNEANLISRLSAQPKKPAPPPPKTSFATNNKSPVLVFKYRPR